MKRIKSIVMMGLLMMAGGFVLTACSSDDSELTSEQTPQAPETQATLDEVLVKVDNCMKQVDFTPLAPLAESLNAVDARSLTSDGEGDKSVADVLSALLAYLKPTYSETDWTSTYQQWSYANLDSTLCLTFDLLFQLGNESAQEGEIGLNQRTYTQSLEVNGVDGALYTIKTKEVKQLTANGLVAENVGVSQLTVYKDGTPLFSVEAMRQLNLGLKNSQLVNESVITGTLSMNGNEFILGYEREGLNSVCRYITLIQNGSHVVTLKMTVGNDFGWSTFQTKNIVFNGEFEVILMGNLASIKGTSTDLKRFYNDGIEMAKASRYGSSMENCQIISDSFNETTSVQLLLAGTNAAQLKLTARQTDVERNLWKPVIVCTSPLIGKNEMTIAEIMDAMDISFKDILELLLGANS